MTAEMLDELFVALAVAWTRYATSRLAGPVSRILVVDPYSGVGSAAGSVDARRARRLLGALGAVAARAGTVLDLVLSNEDPGVVPAIEAALRSAPSDESYPGGVAVEVSCAAPAELAARLGERMHDAARALVLLAPRRAGALPWAVSERFAGQAKTDLLVALPTWEAHRQTPYPEVPVADLPARARRAVHGCSAMLGDARHAWLGAWRDAAARGGATLAEDGFARAYAERLRALPRGGAVRGLHLVPIAGDAMVPAEGDAAHIVFRTGAPATALVLNEALRAVRLRDLRVQEQDRAGPRVVESARRADALDLFGAPTGLPSEAREERVDVAGVAARLTAHFRGRTVAFEEVLRWAADSDLVLGELRRALSIAKRAGTAVYGLLDAAEAMIEFPLAAAPRGRRAARSTSAPELFDGTE